MASKMRYEHLGVVAYSPQDAYRAHVQQGAKLYMQGNAVEGRKHYEAAHLLTGRTGKPSRASWEHVRHIRGAVLTAHSDGGDHELVSHVNSLIENGHHEEAARTLARRKGLPLEEALGRVWRRHQEMNGAPSGRTVATAQDLIREIETHGGGHVPTVYAIVHRHLPNLPPSEHPALARYLHARHPVPGKGA